MVIGLDFYGTVTRNNKIFRNIAQALIAQGHEVYIVSAVKRNNISKLKTELKHSKVPYSYLEIVPYENYWEIPELKLKACKRLGIRMLLDDNEDTCQLLSEQGILTAQVH